MNRRTLLPASATLAALALGWVALAGPINPPAGPIVPTNKTLQEIFDKAAAAEPRTAINATNTPGDADSLFKITQPGSYYLTGNITGVVGKHGIEIAPVGGGGVTLDLNGFALIGVPGSLRGVTATVSLSSGAVFNGTLRSWGTGGVDLGNALSARVENVLAHENGGYGIYVRGPGVIRGCVASANTGNGIRVDNNCTIAHCTAQGNSLDGFQCSLWCTLTACVASGNGSNGIIVFGNSTIDGCTVSLSGTVGISAGNGSTVSGCTVYSSVTDGIACTAGCLILNNTCRQSGEGGDGAGIHAVNVDNRIEGNNVTFADRGIDVDGAGNVIARNTCSGSTNNWDVVAGNVILVISATPAAAVTGDSGGTAPGSTDPNANFSY